MWGRGTRWLTLALLHLAQAEAIRSEVFFLLFDGTSSIVVDVKLGLAGCPSKSGEIGVDMVHAELGRSSNQDGAIGIAVLSRYTQSRLFEDVFRISVSSRRCLPLFSPRDQLIIDVFLLLALPRGDPRWTQLGRCNGPISEYPLASERSREVHSEGDIACIRFRILGCGHGLDRVAYVLGSTTILFNFCFSFTTSMRLRLESYLIRGDRTPSSRTWGTGP
jgi:hypothetical protein